MSYIEKLLLNIKIEWITLGDEGFLEIANSGRKPVKASLRKPGEIPYYGANNIQDYVEGFTHEGKYILIAEDGSKSLENYSIQLTKGKFWANNHIHVIRAKNEITTKFLYHYLQIVNFIPLLSGGGRAKLTKSKLVQITIPIPCTDNPKKSISIQKEIVRILDTFTELTAELTAELTVRKNQYSYYREQLLTFNENKVEYLPMGDDSVGKFIRGGGLQKKDFTDSGVGCIHYGQIYTHYGTYADRTKSFVSKEFAKKARIAKHGDLVIATTSETDGDLCKAVAWLGNEEIAVSSDACFFRHNLNPKYVAYFFQTEQFHKQKRSFITGAKVRRVNASNLEKIKIPVPSSREQERIVSILDKFDILTTSISEGLPKEIELRKKQYEYYRNMLLTFPNDTIEV